MDRRRILQWLSLVPAAGGLPGLAVAQSGPGSAGRSAEALQKEWQSYLPAGFKAPSPTEPVKLDRAAWKQRLSQAQYDVLREEGTERAGTSPLNDEKRAGIFACAGCDLPLFTSAMKFDSGTGWPSFFTYIPGTLATKTDFKLILPRTEYHCVRCGGHHGHVFNDGPAPTGLRYCNNGVALKFIPKGAAA